MDTHRMKTFKNYCIRCCHFDSSSGTCSEIHENVRNYPKKFIAKCDGKFFKDAPNKITEKTEETEETNRALQQKTNVFSAQRFKKSLLLGFCLLIAGQITVYIMNWTFEAYYAVGPGLDPRGLLGLLAFMLFALGIVGTVDGALEFNNYCKEKGIIYLPVVFGFFGILATLISNVPVPYSEWLWRIKIFIDLPGTFFISALAAVGVYLGITANNPERRHGTIPCKLGAVMQDFQSITSRKIY